MANIIAFLLLLTQTVFGSYYYRQSPCDCFSVNLQPGYPRVTGNQVCYQYLIHKKDYSCRMNLDYYILSAYVYMYLLPELQKKKIGTYCHLFFSHYFRHAGLIFYFYDD